MPMRALPSTEALRDASRQGDNTCHHQGGLRVPSSIPTGLPFRGTSQH